MLLETCFTISILTKGGCNEIEIKLYKMNKNKLEIIKFHLKLSQTNLKTFKKLVI